MRILRQTKNPSRSPRHLGGRKRANNGRRANAQFPVGAGRARAPQAPPPDNSKKRGARARSSRRRVLITAPGAQAARRSLLTAVAAARPARLAPTVDWDGP